MKTNQTFEALLRLCGCVLLLTGCTVEADVRCNFGQTACPETFYCGGEWCYPNGTGPGSLDMAGAPDMRVDAGPLDMAPAPDMAQVDMRVDGGPLTDMTPPDPDMASPADMAVDMASPLDMGLPMPDMDPPGPDMGAPQLDMDPPAPDMVVDMAPLPDMDLPAPDMDPPAPDMDPPAPDMDPPAPQIMLDTYLPRDGVLSTAPDRQQLTITLTLGDFHDQYMLLVGFLPVVNGELFDAERCRAIADRESPVQFLRGQGTLTIPLEDLRAQPNNPAHVCVVDPAPGGAVVHLIARVDVEPPAIRVDPFDTNVGRTSGLLPVVIESDDVARADVALFTEEGCMTAYDGALRRVEQPDEPDLLAFELTDLRVGQPYVVSVGAIDAVGNVACVDRVFMVDAPPALGVAGVSCAIGDETEVDLAINDDGEVEVSVVVDETTCLVDFDEEDAERIDFECTADCVITLDLRDDVDVVRVALPVDAFDGTVPPFLMPFALSYRVNEALGVGAPSGAVRTRRAGIDTVIVSGRSDDGAGLMQWRQGPNGWFGTANLSLAGVLTAGTFIGREPPQTFIGNVGYIDDIYTNVSCGFVLMGGAPFDLGVGLPLSNRPCSVQQGNVLTGVQAVDLDGDAFDDVVGVDDRGRIDLWEGAERNFEPVVNLYAGPMPVDFVALPAIERVVVALGEDPEGVGLGAQVIDMQGAAMPLFAGEAVSCVAAVDWLGAGFPGVAICLPDRVEILVWNGAFLGDGVAFGEPFDTVQVPLGPAYLTDLLFERADHPFPSALWVDSLDRAGAIDQAGVSIWDVPEPVNEIIDLDPAATGFDAALLARQSSRVYWMRSDDAESGFAHRLVGPDAGLPPLARPIGGADVTGDYVDDLVFMTLNNAARLESGEIIGGQFTPHLVTAANVETDHLGVIGDFNADGRRELAAVRALVDGTLALQVSRATNPDATNTIDMNVSVELPIDADGRRAWGLAAGPLRADTPVDLIAVGVNQELRIYQADFAADGALGLVRSIPDVAPGEIAIGRFDQAPAVMVVRQDLGTISIDAWTVDGVFRGAGPYEGSLEHVRVADMDGARHAFMSVRDLNGNMQVLRLDDQQPSLVFEVGDVELVDFAFGDVDGDQRAELVLGVGRLGVEGPTVRTVERGADGRFVERLDDRYVAPVDAIVDGVYVGDFDGDRRPDRAAVVTIPGQGRAVVLSGRVAD